LETDPRTSVLRSIRLLTFAALILGGSYLVNGVYVAGDGHTVDGLAATITGIAALVLTRTFYLYWELLEHHPVGSVDAGLPSDAERRCWRHLVFFIVVVALAGMLSAISWAFAFLGALLHAPVV
jgi:hypothetical protein